MSTEFNLRERVNSFSAAIIKIAGQFPKDTAGSHIAGQIIRSGTAPALHYGEAQGGESPKDFIHKMKGALKELRETYNALQIAKEMSWLPEKELEWALDENDQLIAIFFTSIRTAQNNSREDEVTKKVKKKRRKHENDEKDEDNENDS
jgi:four helix bundle protein